MIELREAIARAVYDIEVDNYGGVRWGESVQTDPYTCELPDTEMAYEIADKVLALVMERNNPHVGSRFNVDDFTGGQGDE